MRGIEPSVWVEHFPRYAVEDFAGDGAEELAAPGLPGVGTNPTWASRPSPFNMRSKREA
jgi:hypothetical protein